MYQLPYPLQVSGYVKRLLSVVYLLNKVYYLSTFKQLYKFGKQNIILPKKIVYTFKRNIEPDEINVTVDAIRRKYIIRQNNIETKAAIVIENIINITKEYIPTDSTSKPRKVFNWVLSGEDYTWKIESNVEDTISPTIVEKLKELDDEEVFPEGKEKFRVHKSKERNQKLVTLKKQKALLRNQNLPCEICNFSFKIQYGQIGDKFIETHHILPISKLTEETETKLDDLILVCSNCHKMIHRRRPWLTIEEMKKLLKND